jgi:hypothetical protein
VSTSGSESLASTTTVAAVFWLVIENKLRNGPGRDNEGRPSFFRVGKPLRPQSRTGGLVGDRSETTRALRF